MKANKEIQVHILPTEDYSNIYLNSIEEIGNLVYNNNNFPFHEDMIACNDFIPQHLYFTEEGKPEEGDWCINPKGLPDIFGFDYRAVYTREEILKCKKIISTTDTKLNLPQPSQAFIEAFCKAGGIKKVMVEYEEKYIEPPSNIHSNRGYFITQPKVNSHNEITISSIKDRWTREEVTELLSSMSSYTHVHNRVVVGKELNNWVEENL